MVDLEVEFGKLKATDPSKALYCAQDSHWSPWACEVAADLVAGKVAGEDWLVKDGGGIAVGEVETLSFHGDLLTDAEKGSWAKEELPIRKASKGGAPVETDKDSPVLVVGDSHTLVFNEGGEMHCRGGGLVDHLAGSARAAGGPDGEQGIGWAFAEDGDRAAVVQEPDMWAKKKLCGVVLFGAGIHPGHVEEGDSGEVREEVAGAVGGGGRRSLLAEQGFYLGLFIPWVVFTLGTILGGEASPWAFVPMISVSVW